jgi:DNA-binding transcriptional regulator YhcF (GntR family)
MQLWFSPHSDIPLYRQLVTQVTLAILSGDLQPGDRLPSTRELARRFAIHPNTISAGYRQLESDGWTETRHGSGVFVRTRAIPPTTPEQVLDLHIAAFFRAVRELNLPAPYVRSRVADWLAAPPPDHLLLIDPDPDLRKILLTEIRSATTFPVREATPEDCADPALLTAAIPLCRPSKTDIVRAALPSGIELLTLQITSATAWLAPWMPILQQPTAKNHLVAIVSHWPDFLTLARTMLTAAGIPAEALLTCDATQPHWQRGLDQASVLLTDAHTAPRQSLPSKPRKIIFPLIADTTRDQLSHFAPLPPKNKKGAET